jgi:hypothetical protein
MGWKRTSLIHAGRRGLASAGLLVLIAIVTLALTGCAGELPTPGQISSTVAMPSTTTTESQGDALGDQVGATWSEAMQKLVPLLEGTPSVASLQAPVSQLKEEYVRKMVALGKQIQALDAAQGQEAYDRAMGLLEATANTDWFQSYVRLYDQYAAVDDDTTQNFAILLSTFNTLTQYAFFDILKAEAPDEAQRLGIE